MPKAIALIPARVGSQRVKLKNIRPLNGHPLIAYTIASTLESNVFKRVIVSTDSPTIGEIAHHYGAEVPFLRPPEFATTTSPDIEWVRHAIRTMEEHYDAFALLRTTSPFRHASTLRRAWDQFVASPDTDSLRAVELCRQHPGKMWVLEEDRIRPLLNQAKVKPPWHSRQYQDLPKVYVQNSSLEIAWSRVVAETDSIAGHVLVPFHTEGAEGFSIDYEDDWWLAERMISRGEAVLPGIPQSPFPVEGAT